MTEHKTYDLAYWINERYAIKTRKESDMAPPWTGDPIMASVRWCNVHREDDAVTRWMRAYWKMDGNSVWFWVLGRMLNYIPTLEYLLRSDCGDLESFKERLKDRRFSGEKVFTSAYTISTCGKRMDKIDYVCDWVVQACVEAGEPEFTTLAETHEQITCIDGLGSFLAAQVIADLKNCEGHPLQNAPDWWTWSAPGPGSLRGLNWYFHGQPEGNITASKYPYHINLAYLETAPLVLEEVLPISMQDFQNCLCEFSKYMKVKHRRGHVRNRYVAG